VQLPDIVDPFVRALSGAGGVGFNPAEEPSMQWHTPKLVEIACGCEINAYFPADL
jgi:coenzyme PQQ precursor peptide PqqA